MTVIAVAGASGGLGASTAAAHLCWRAAPGRGCLVDAEPSRGAVDVTAGVDHVLGPRWGSFSRLEGPANGPAILTALPRTSRYAVLAGSPSPPPPSVVGAVLAALADSTDLLVIDAGTAAALDEPWLAGCDALVVVAGVGVRHLADLDRLVDRLAGTGVPAHLVTRGPRRLAHLTESVALHVGLPTLGHWLDDPAVPRDLERGIPPGEHSHGFDALADRLLSLLDWGDLRRTG